MSIHMPTLFDDEEYFVPPPKKEARKKKDISEVKEEEQIAPEGPSGPDVVVSAQPDEAEGQLQPEVAAEEASQPEAAENIVPDHVIDKEEVVIDAPEITTASSEVVPDTITEVEESYPEIEPKQEVEAEDNLQPEVMAEEASEPEAAENIVPDHVVDKEEVVIDARETTTASSEVVPDTVTEVEKSYPEIEPAPEAEVSADTQEVVSEATEITPEVDTDFPEIADAPAIELEHQEQVPENIAETLVPEVIEVSVVDELTVELPKPTPGITFEIPEEEEEPAIDLEMTARPIPTVREEKVDDLDQLMRTELISQDYTAFSGFEFEPLPEKKKIIPEPEAEQIAEEPAGPGPEKETMIQAIQEIDAADLDFEFESAALASSLPEFELENKYYTIGEVAALFGVNVSHIRFWTTEFNLKVRTTRKGDRLYNPENIARLRLIHHLVKENGFTIKGAKDKLKNQKQNVSVQIDLKNKLSGLKDKLERIKKNL